MRLIHSPRRFTPMIAATLALAASQAHADITTPDAYGYRAYDVTAILNLSKFEDISQSANLILTGDDKVAKNLALGFTFNIYGQNFTQVGVSDNGLMQFSDFPTAQYENKNLKTTSPATTAPTLAVLWDDWIANRTGQGAGVYRYQETIGGVGHRQFISQWNVVDHYTSSPSTVTFQAVLFEGSNDILFRYQDVLTGEIDTTNGGSATVGIQDTNGQNNNRVTQWSYNAPVIRDGEAILFTTRTIVPEASTAITFGSLLSMGGLGCARAWRRRKRA